MKDYFWEILYVLGLSKRTQWAIVIGLLGYICIIIIGDYNLNNFHFTGVLEPLSDVAKSKLNSQYEKAALAILCSCWVIAIKFFIKDKKRFL